MDKKPPHPSDGGFYDNPQWKSKENNISRCIVFLNEYMKHNKVRDNRLRQSSYEKGNTMTKGMIFTACIVIIVLAACSPSTRVVQTAIAGAQAVLSTVAAVNAPEASPTAIPAAQSTPLSTQPSENKYDMILSDIADNLLSLTDEIDSVTAIRRGVDSLEVEIKIVQMSEDNQPNVTYDAIHLLATTFGNMSEEKALNFVTGHPQHFSISLTSSSNNGEHKFSSITSYDTLVKIVNGQVSFIDWVSEANAHFVN